MQFINAGPGAKYRFLGDFASDQDGFRRAFIEAFRNHVPGAVESLREVVPVYRQLLALWEVFHSCDEARRGIYARFARDGRPVSLGLNRNVVLTEGKAARPSFSWKSVSHATESMYPDLLPIKDGLKRWGEGWHMAETGWFMDTALETVESWVAYPKLEEVGAYIPRGCAEWAAVTDQEAQFSLESEGWIPNIRHWSEFEAQVRTQLDSKLKNYRKRIIETAEGRGFRRVSKQHRPEHFIWLALSHCAGWKLEQVRQYQQTHKKEVRTSELVGGMDGGDVTAISKGIKSAAELIGLQLPRKRGRPKKP